MRNLTNINRLVPVLAFGVTVSAACALVAAGCGSSSSSSKQDAGAESDGTLDALEETTVPQDATPPSDAGAGPDGDAGPSGEAGMSHTNDSGTGDSSTSASLTAESFPGLVAAALCTTTANCCGTSGDAATFNWQGCFNSKLPNGFGGSAIGSNLLDGGHVTFNAAQAQTCLDTISAVDCAANELTSAEAVQLYQSCFAAYAGTLPAGSACAATIECAPGNYCMPVDGGAGDAGAIGSCQALAGAGGACGFLGNATQGQSACSYRGSGSNGLFCQNISGDAGITQLNSSEWTCQPQWPNGSECYANQDCTSFICHQVGTLFQCGSAGNWANPSTCATYTITPDAGGGG
jgi:hypothetical protein